MARFVRLLLLVCFLVAPSAVVSLVLAGRLNASLADCYPNRVNSIWNDEVHYSDEIAAFAATGFGSGYFVVNEKPAPASWSHFGPHGPGFPIVYGSLAKLLGWYPASGPLFNVLVLLLGSIAWLWLVRPDARQLAAATLVMATFWPCLLFIPSTMQESLHCAIACAMAGFAHRSISATESKVRSCWPFLTFVSLASLVRVSWSLVLIPWTFIVLADSPRWRRLALTALSFAGPALAFMIWSYLCSPYNNYLSGVLAGIRSAPVDTVMDFAAHGWRATREALSWNDSALEILERQEVAALALFAIYTATRSRLQRVAPRVLGDAALALAAGLALAGMTIPAIVVVALWRFDPQPRGQRAILFGGLSLALLAVAVFGLYDAKAFRDYRVLGPHLLLCLLVLASGPAYRWAIAAAVASMLFTSGFITTFQRFHSLRVANLTATVDLRPCLKYNPVDDPWNNTLLAGCLPHEWPLLQTPAGIGVTIRMPEGKLDLPVKSRYILLRGSEVESWSGCRLRLLQKTAVGNLYVRTD